jgi:putative nucleotidyltransferase with HDIG domain
MLATAKIEINSLVETELPPLPSSALRVANLVQDVNTSTRAIADAIGSDPVLAARVLRAANSPLYAMERRVTALPMAVNTMGNNAIHMLVMVYSASDTFNKKGKQTTLERIMWEHSLAVAALARELSSILGLRGMEETFLCGLLHDIGQLLMLRHDQELYSKVDMSNEQRLLETEQEIYGYTHAQVGALVARRWNLPDDIGYVINYHHQPSDATKMLAMTRVIDLASQIANFYGVGTHQEPDMDLSLTESAIALDISDEKIKAVWEKVQSQIGEMKSVFT